MLRNDRGSALMLMPAAVVVVIVLAAITMDLSLVHLGRREAVAAAEAAANDAATFALDETAYRTGAGYSLDPTRAHRAMEQSIVGVGLSDDLVSPPQLTIDGTTVHVRLTIRVDYVFAAGATWFTLDDRDRDRVGHRYRPLTSDGVQLPSAAWLVTAQRAAANP